MNSDATAQNFTPFTLTADDYAITRGVSRAILTLLEEGCITATGVMTNRPAWREGASPLAHFIGKADLGLHLTFTCGEPLTQMKAFAPNGEFPKLAPILAQGLGGALPKAEIIAEITAQLDAFEERLGQPPDFVDGHQHIHAMPGVRRLLVEVLTARYSHSKPYIRNPADHLGRILKRRGESRKAMLVTALTAPFAAGMRARGFCLNESFSGYSAFDPTRDYAADFAQYLIAPSAHHLIMCHPGEMDDEIKRLDPTNLSRDVEFAFFRSPAFRALCAQNRMHPSRFKKTLK